MKLILQGEGLLWDLKVRGKSSEERTVLQYMLWGIIGICVFRFVQTNIHDLRGVESGVKTPKIKNQIKSKEHGVQSCPVGIVESFSLESVMVMQI